MKHKFELEEKVYIPFADKICQVMGVELSVMHEEPRYKLYGEWIGHPKIAASGYEVFFVWESELRKIEA